LADLNTTKDPNGGLIIVVCNKPTNGIVIDGHDTLQSPAQ
jgi:hypothetical protein